MHNDPLTESKLIFMLFPETLSELQLSIQLCRYSKSVISSFFTKIKLNV